MGSRGLTPTPTLDYLPSAAVRPRGATLEPSPPGPDGITTKRGEFVSRNGVRVEGLNALTRDLVQLGVELDDLKDAFGGIAAEGARLAQQYAPRRSGRLAASVRGNRAKNKAVILAGRSSVVYAPVVNYGWPARGIRPDRFMQRADEALQPTVVQELTAAINRAIDRRGLG